MARGGLVPERLDGQHDPLHQFGYATIGYGAHAPGFVLASVATFTMQMLCALAADRSLGLGGFDAAEESLRPWLSMVAPSMSPGKAEL